MNRDIEKMDRARRSYLRGYLVAFVIFVILMFTRFFFRADNLNREPIGIVVLIGLIITVVIQAYYMMRLSLLQKKIRGNPELKEALEYELVRLHELKSWKAAYLAAIATTSFFAIVSFSYPICDLVMVALSSIIIGAGAYRMAFYILDRA
ncbi:MAG: hypothetical protein V3W18_08655 [candidate division Zixibacteria bacterium]